LKTKYLHGITFKREVGLGQDSIIFAKETGKLELIFLYISLSLALYGKIPKRNTSFL